jgi:hypothetical protein
MKSRSDLHSPHKAAALAITLLAVALASLAAVETNLVARARLFPSIGAGVTAMRSDAAGRIYVLTARAGVQIFDSKGQPAGHIPSAASPDSALLYGTDLDIDGQGRVYVADRAGNAVKVFSPDGHLERQIHIAAPISVAVLPNEELAVASMRSPKLVTVFGPQGRVAREFGEITDVASREELNRYTNVGRLTHDASGHLYYAFTFLPEPTVRRYDRFGFSDFELVLNTPEFTRTALATRKQLTQQEKGGPPDLKPVFGPIAVDSRTGEIWAGIGVRLLRFAADGSERGSYLLFTNENVRIEASALVLEPARILVASAELGVFEFPRPGGAIP